VWFGLPAYASPERAVRDGLKFYGVGSALAGILAGYLGLSRGDARVAASRIISAFAREVASRRWRVFHYLDPARHTVYSNYLGFCAILESDVQKALVKGYALRDEECRLGLALTVLEEVASISRFLPRGLGLGGAEERLGRAMEELKAEPKDAVVSGFARLALLPPSTEEELERELAKYTEGRFQSRELREAWREAVKTFRREASPRDAFFAYLAGRGAGYRLPEKYRAYESGGVVMVAGPDYLWHSVEWYRVRGGRWGEVALVGHLPGPALQALEDLMAEDFKRGIPPARIADAVRHVRDAGFAQRGFPELAREFYKVARDGKAYAKLKVGRTGKPLVIHVIQDSDEWRTEHRFLFIVEYAGQRHLLNTQALGDLLWHIGKLGPATALATLTGGGSPPPSLTVPAEDVARMLDKPAVRAGIPDDIASWLLQE